MIIFVFLCGFLSIVILILSYQNIKLAKENRELTSRLCIFEKSCNEYTTGWTVETDRWARMV